MISHTLEPFLRLAATRYPVVMDGLRRRRVLANKKPQAPAALVYGGDASFVRDGIRVLPWFSFS